MKKSFTIKSIFTLLILILFSSNVNSQSKKEQILSMTNQIDSLTKVTKDLDGVIVDHKQQIKNLDKEIENLNSVLNTSDKKNSDLNLELNKLKDTIFKYKEKIKFQDYQLNQKNTDSLKYFKLISKLSDPNIVITDSIKTVQILKKSKIEPTKIENFYFKDFKSVITGVPDEKNRYTWTFELFQKVGGDYLKVSNSTLFNNKKQELLDIINQKIQADFNNAYKSNPNCFKSKTLPTYDYKNLGIEFKDRKINFFATFDYTTENCLYLYGYTSVEFEEKEIEMYLK